MNKAAVKKEMPKAYEPGLYEDDIYRSWEKSGAFQPEKLKLGKGAKNYAISTPRNRRFALAA